jgi:nucleoid-associated protein YgaU
MFQLTSRYYGLETAELETAQGSKVRYVRRRFAPQPERFDLLTEHTVAEGDRLDTIAAQYLGDAEQFWRICDANNAIRPDELIETLGRRLRVTLPEGIGIARPA